MIESGEPRVVGLEHYRWGDKLCTEAREWLLEETRTDIEDDISDADLYLRWLRT